ncbi:TPA: alpha/beta hydrolase [Streptococcus equi subsp. zooepidemicus]|nr:alpha/beta hydrolase [Streptococcus equi subsp. zooepidemicus]HEL0394835.1 alpha/beta hydrolase [Streptococcus equi subsp. zooepidemicus]HEL0398870.1 alpha/beta hydrolase [Streptococcus equi subsp. zooepidemicus]
MKTIRLSKYFGILLLLLTLASVGASFYFFHVAQVREEKSFINNKKRTPGNPLYPAELAFDSLVREKRSIVNRGHQQTAWYLPASQDTHKTAIVVHGFTNDKEDMKPYAMLFHSLGYNVLIPDNEAHGESEGDLIGYGWNDRLNLLAWIDLLVSEDKESQISLFGLSMGAATVMMASGEQLPSQVVNIIEDCGYTSVWDELKFQAKAMYNLPAFPLLYEVSAFSKIRAGFSYGEASSVKQLAKNKLPVLFIHGDKDTFVPTEMVYQNYQATKGPKELMVVKGAKHAKSFETNPDQYKEKIAAFLQKYEK